MELDYVKKCDYVAIFDADHEPPPEFLMRTIPFLMRNPALALVQARWKFGESYITGFCTFAVKREMNANECMMTGIQEMSLNNHFKVEQQSGSSALAFFGFNGTAGVRRILAINEAQGWKERENDRGGDGLNSQSNSPWLEVTSELPSNYRADRYQQHRWACGPANLFKKIAMDIATAKKVSLLKRLFLLYNFFFARRIVSHNCIVIPVSSFFPEVVIPKWGVFYIPTVITLLNSIGTPRSDTCTMFFFTIRSFLGIVQIFTFDCDLDILGERHVLAPMQSCHHWLARSRESKGVCGHRETRRCIEDQTSFNSCKETPR
ncbi:hypothetical protein C4D60_Mb10t11590 [Musa balbisiana]|uniref:Uncharacterized protein n=1 Tax=Musa balbisiana TaxID=52838 RepID=A0A4S8IYV1_MUSBA|nr:hypothetical protein C4D60_Mb10t11590 [Musa balbisiana]